MLYNWHVNIYKNDFSYYTKEKVMYQKQIKEDNDKRIFNYIYREKLNISIKKTSVALELSLPTVKRIFLDLLKKGILVEVKKTSSTTGRKHQEYAINNEFCYSIGISIYIEKMIFLLVDGNGRVKEKLVVKENMDEKCLLKNIRNELRGFLNELPYEIKEKIVGIGISVPGMAIKESDIVEISEDIRISFKDMSNSLEEFGYKLYIENRSNCIAITEKILGHGKQAKNFILLDIDSKIGMSCFNENFSKLSMNFFAGRIEHLCIEVDGNPCECGDKGCLGTYISNKKLLQDFKDEFKEVNRYHEIFTEDYLATPKGRKILSNYIKYLSVGIKNLIYLYNPNKIIITGDISTYKTFVEKELLENIYSNNIFFKGSETIIFSSFSKYSSSMGASLIPIIDNFF